MNFQEFKQKYQKEINKILSQALSVDNLLEQSMRYSLEAPGKRLRSLLLLAVVNEAKKEITPTILELASLIEWIHTYSLIHDDLPAMDDDTLRRGKPTNHIEFGEATAILAGDALLTDTFYHLASLALPAEIKIQLIQGLGYAAGSKGMVLGQSLDMQAEDKAVPLDELIKIHNLKTGALLEYAVYAGTIVAEYDAKTQAALLTYAKHLGLAFQIRDDILDITQSKEELGKDNASDLKNEKSTYPKLLGLEQSKQKLHEEVEAALEALPAEMILLREIIMQLEVK